MGCEGLCTVGLSPRPRSAGADLLSVCFTLDQGIMSGPSPWKTNKLETQTGWR